jgi:hypothetical protein
VLAVSKPREVRNRSMTQASLEVRPAHVLIGLGNADRRLLAVCLALFEDTALTRRLEEIYRDVSQWVSKLANWDVREAAEIVDTRLSFWLDSRLSDQELRLVLWIYLREAFELPARLSVSTRGAEAMAAELAAAAVRASDAMGKVQHATLAELVSAVVNELLSVALDASRGQLDDASKNILIGQARKRLQEIGDGDRKRLLEAVGAKELNDEAIRKILLTGGGLTAVGASVGIAGFSAYILAAQASAFIPLVSGPALVSAVAVVSNPITVVATTGAVAWWLATSSRRKAQLAVGLRVVALLALQGFESKSSGLARALESFAVARKLRAVGDLESAVVSLYKAEWARVEPARVKRRTVPSLDVQRLMTRRVADSVEGDGAVRLGLTRDEARNASILAALTLGDIAYSAAAIRPEVIAAADFSRLENLGDPVAFAEAAKKIVELAPEGFAGAMNNLKGYVAEQLVAAELVAQGHDVEFPETANQEGWDILVDDHEFQVKWHDSLEGLERHFSRYEYPVLANSELFGKVPNEWADRVFFVEGYSDELVTQVTEQSVEAGAGMLNPDVPALAIALSAGRSLYAFNQGRVTGVQAVEQILIDGSTRAGLAVLGGYAGAGIGYVVFGPAGGLVFGSVLAVLGQAQTTSVARKLDSSFDTRAYKNWQADGHRALDSLVTCLRAELEGKLTRLHQKHRAMTPGGIRDYIRARIEDEATFLRESNLRLEGLPGHEVLCEERSLSVIRWIASSTIHPVAYQAEMNTLNKVLAARPSLTDRASEVVSDTWKEIVRSYKTARTKGRTKGNAQKTPRRR